MINYGHIDHSAFINVFRGHLCILQSNLWVGCSLTDMFGCSRTDGLVAV